ncbi:exo-beta-N-acetylmuramidase NamZ family protein [Bacteroides sedimenti]
MKKKRIFQSLCAALLLCMPFNVHASEGKSLTHYAASNVNSATGVKVGAEQMDKLLSLLKNKRVALVVNHTSIVGEKKVHLLDTLLASGISVKKVFAPEHGFRGNADAGEKITDGKDSKTGIPIISLYGKNRKPSAEQMSDVDVVLFDIQDVGARFYTYISTMHYVMEACAENNKKMIIADRPNPCDFVDGPVMKPSLRSFVGMDLIPLLHGCTVGELAQMINGEGWLEGKKKCALTVIKVKNWKHGQPYSLPVKPSPNLANDQAINLYASLCLFEATNISVGRGTYFPFEVIGAPDKKFGEFTFTPTSLAGFDKNPMHKDQVCYGEDLRKAPRIKGFTLKYFMDFYNKSGQGADFISRPRWFDQLMGDASVRKEIIEGKSEKEIKAGWQKELAKYKKMRAKYLLYTE